MPFRRDLAVGDNQQNVKTFGFLGYPRRGGDEWCKIGRSRQCHLFGFLGVRGQYLFKTMTGTTAGVDGKDPFVSGDRVTKTKRRYDMIVVKLFQTLPHRIDYLFIRIFALLVQRMQTFPPERLFALPRVRLGEINAYDQMEDSRPAFLNACWTWCTFE